MKHSHESRAEKPNLMPMIDVAFLVLIFFMALPMKRLDHKLETELPKGLGWQATLDVPPLAVRIAIRKTGEKVHYRVGVHRAATAAGLTPVLRKFTSDELYEIDASKAVPHQAVISMIDVLKGLKYKKLSFTGVRSPTPQLRRLSPLPQPE